MHMSTHLCDILWPECVLCLPYNFTHLSSNTNKHESVTSWSLPHACDMPHAHTDKTMYPGLARHCFGSCLLQEFLPTSQFHVSGSSRRVLVCQQPPFSQQLPVLTFWLFFYADSFGLWYVQAITQSPPMHPLNRFCDIFQCKRSGCN